MFRFKNILVPVDFSPLCNMAFSYTIDMAKSMGSVLHLLHVIELNVYPNDLGMTQISFADIDGGEEDDAVFELKKMQILLSELEINSVIKILRGKPSEAILEYAKDNDIDLICISTHGKSGLSKLMFGSTAEKVLGKSQCPVLAVRSPSK